MRTCCNDGRPPLDVPAVLEPAPALEEPELSPCVSTSRYSCRHPWSCQWSSAYAYVSEDVGSVERVRLLTSLGRRDARRCSGGWPLRGGAIAAGCGRGMSADAARRWFRGMRGDVGEVGDAEGDAKDPALWLLPSTVARRVGGRPSSGDDNASLSILLSPASAAAGSSGRPGPGSARCFPLSRDTRTGLTGRESTAAAGTVGGLDALLNVAAVLVSPAPPVMLSPPAVPFAPEAGISLLIRLVLPLVALVGEKVVEGGAPAPVVMARPESRKRGLGLRWR